MQKANCCRRCACTVTNAFSNARSSFDAVFKHRHVGRRQQQQVVIVALLARRMCCALVAAKPVQCDICPHYLHVCVQHMCRSHEFLDHSETPPTHHTHSCSALLVEQQTRTKHINRSICMPRSSRETKLCAL